MIPDAAAPSIEVVMPLRNPTAVLRVSLESLVRQSSRAFSVLISDNWSTSGLEILEEAEASLRAAGLAVRRLRPPVELGRVEHWNWSHSVAVGEWIKPLFAGDWLNEDYIALIGAAIAKHPPVEIVNSSMTSHLSDGSTKVSTYGEGLRSPAQVLEAAFQQGNCFGGPINTCFRKLAFTAVGGYPPALPVSADFWLLLMLAMRAGMYSCGPAMAHFNFHPTRFSTNFPWTRIDGRREHFIILLAATSQAQFSEIPFRVKLRNRYFWELLKGHLKDGLQRWRSR